MEPPEGSGSAEGVGERFFADDEGNTVRRGHTADSKMAVGMGSHEEGIDTAGVGLPSKKRFGVLVEAIAPPTLGEEGPPIGIYVGPGDEVAVGVPGYRTGVGRRLFAKSIIL